MILRERPSLLQLFFIWRGSILPRVLPEIAFVALVAIGVTWSSRHFGEWFPDYSAAPFALLGLAFSIFLGFRNNACYDRWWEARKQWGQLLVDMRSLARDSVVLRGQENSLSLRRRFLRRNVAIALVLAGLLRGRARPLVFAAAASYLETEDIPWLEAQRNPVDALLRRQGEELAQALAEGHLSDILYRGLADRLLSLSGVQAACERIRHTPLPFAYTLLLHRTAYLFCLILPFGLARAIGWATPLMTAILAYAFFGLDALGDELEDPFGLQENDLPLDALVRVVEVDMGAALGEEDLPDYLLPEGFILR